MLEVKGLDNGILVANEERTICLVINDIKIKIVGGGYILELLIDGKYIGSLYGIEAQEVLGSYIALTDDRYNGGKK